MVKIRNFRNMANSSAQLVEHSFEDIKQNLLKSEVGHVSFTKNLTTRIATIFLDHPEKRNAMSGKMMVEFRNCIEALEKWDEGKAIIITGKGTNFCSGGDLDFAKANATAQAGLEMATWMQDALKRLQQLPLISVCLIHGPTLGGGAEIATFCDFIIAADNVRYGFVHGKMGITPAWGGSVSLVNKIGRNKALDILLTSRILDAKECVQIGLAETVVPSDIAFGKTLEWLTPRLQHNYTIVRALKKIVVNTVYESCEDAFKLEKFIFAPFWGSQINQEALKKNIKHQQKSHM